MFANKWVTFVASALVQATSGHTYSFSIYAAALKQQLGLTQTELSSIGFAINMGGYFALISGAIYDCLSVYPRLGPRHVMGAWGQLQLLLASADCLATQVFPSYVSQDILRKLEI